MKKLFILFLFVAGSSFAQKKDLTPVEKVKNVADRVINETAFEFATVKQKALPDLQVVEFSKAFAGKKSGSAYAFSKITVTENMKIHYGISFSEPLKIWVNEKLVFEHDKSVKFFYRETVSNLFRSNDTINVDLLKGENSIVIQSSLKGNPFIYLKELTEKDLVLKSKFIPVEADNKSTWAWGFLSASPKITDVTEKSLHKEFISNLYSGKAEKDFKLSYPPVNDLKKLVIGEKNTFKKDSYADWNYPNGALMMVLLNLADASGDDKYHQFVKKYCEFIDQNLPMLRKQYYKDHDLRGSYLRIFRKSMLDDAGAPVYPFAQITIRDKRKDFLPLVKERADYITNEQERLPDGTLCRPDPKKYSIWADDLFMSTPLLLRAGKIFNNNKYFDDAARQIINFNKYLYDAATGMYKHGWFSETQEQSKFFWGRANGWIIWAESEALLLMPKDHPAYKKIEEIYKANLSGLVKYQDESGIWHQIMNDKDSFGETSCTAMFALGMARGIMNGTLDKSFAAPALKAWRAVEEKINENGIVKDICQGTGIGFEDTFYKTRERFDNDPRGLGAVITAGIEIDKLQKFLKK